MVEIVKEQHGFVEDVGIRNATFMPRILEERAVEVKKICVSASYMTPRHLMK